MNNKATKTWWGQEWIRPYRITPFVKSRGRICPAEPQPAAFWVEKAQQKRAEEKNESQLKQGKQGEWFMATVRHDSSTQLDRQLSCMWKGKCNADTCETQLHSR